MGADSLLRWLGSHGASGIHGHALFRCSLSDASRIFDLDTERILFIWPSVPHKARQWGETHQRVRADIFAVVGVGLSFDASVPDGFRIFRIGAAASCQRSCRK